MKTHVPSFIMPLLLGLLFLCGCDFQTPNRVEEIKIVQGERQCALPGEAFAVPLRVELFGPRERGFLGGKGTRQPVAGIPVRFEPVAGAELRVEPAEEKSNAGGVVSAKIFAGKKTGDQYLKIIPEGFESCAAVLRFVVGAKLSGGEKEYKAGVLSEPVSIQLVDRDGKPAAGIPVYFRLLSSPDGQKSGAEIEHPEMRTGSDGIARTRVKIGSATGAYRIGVEVSAPEKGLFFRTQEIRLLGFNALAVVIAVLGGLALFVFGMKLMGDGIQKVAGENMKKLLQFFARNGLVAVLAGTVVTAVIQSSSATTVMVIGFINAGLLNLQQAIGIIFGANIGTTVTAQIISFNLSGIVMPAITAGFLLTLFAGRTVKGWGETILGFGLLFFGMGIMSGELKELGNLPSFVHFFRSFDCRPDAGSGVMPFGAVFGAIGIGVFATILIQSSSAAMGIVLALAGSGLINFYTAVPLLVGTNIGTTVTAQLAAIPANRVAKQAALAHTLFNLFGALLLVVTFYIPYRNTPVFLYFINAITPGDVFAAIPQNIERHIAMAHTFFNIATVLLLLPFLGGFARLCNWMLPLAANIPVRIERLEPHLLSTPSVALEQSISALRSMVGDAWKMIDAAVNRHFLEGDLSEENLSELAAEEEKIDAMQEAITAYLVKITRKPLTVPQSELIPLLMHCANDAERIGDHAENILQLAERLRHAEHKLSNAGRKEINKMWEVLEEQKSNVMEALGSDNPETIAFALKNEKKINKLAAKYEDSHIERLRKGTCSASTGIIFIEMLGEFEKIGDHLSNIAERTPEIQKHFIQL